MHHLLAREEMTKCKRSCMDLYKVALFIVGEPKINSRWSGDLTLRDYTPHKK